jgi:hypothetical protein
MDFWSLMLQPLGFGILMEFNGFNRSALPVRRVQSELLAKQVLLAPKVPQVSLAP